VTEPLLSVENLSVAYGAVKAVEGLRFEVGPGRLVGLIGSNGAGKTSALDALTGFAAATGRAMFLGKNLLELPAYKRARLGVTRTWQSVELFDDLTVRENFQIAASNPGVGAAITSFLRRSQGQQLAEAAAALEQVGLGDVLELKPTELSHGQRKLVGLARSLLAKPTLLLADEPAAGLDMSESKRLGVVLSKLVSNGLSLLLIDHDMELVLGICDYVYVLDHGKLIAEGAPSQIRENAMVIESYLGRPTTPAVAEEPSGVAP
jgi:branched-chain amino acid transport system ATP-binding protein